ncbi:phosphotyrosine protein phosphatase [Deinococcus multiflagellatus]|uniref:Phosphotyrosine protein phosphatase n=1 Tax=Deinococcus multiflagellatus TaxID=1656887 RepID=A0ABW1ZGB8_9DEIO|nr:phosphotyrosine protein phosphatase [Deinococcus multiflagellatus]MBZ9716107.1 phosphotyrosine protein phosphatase [Deinococcus multiflagellatus]
MVFLCTQNKLRSLTAEVLFRETGEWEVVSAGTHPAALTPLTRDLLEWADVAVCMQKQHRDVVRTQFRGALPDERVVTLGIPDNYEFMAPELVTLLQQKVPARLGTLTPRTAPAD